MECKCCERNIETRLGICFDCANCESVINDGTDMFDGEIENIDGYTLSMAKLKYVLNRFKLIKEATK